MEGVQCSPPASLSDFLEWFRAKVVVFPTAFVECNENITCYALIGIFQMLVGKGVNFCWSSRSWLLPVMLWSFRIFH
jgi:hypothetical protein